LELSFSFFTFDLTFRACRRAGHW